MPPLLAGAALRSTDDGALEAVRTLRPERDRYLDDHRVDGRPVLPFATAMELMAEAAVAACPGREVAGLRGIRLLHGVTVDDADGVAVRITAAPRGDDVEAAIASAKEARHHYRATVALRAGTAAEPPAAPPPLTDLPPFPMSIDDAYRDLLFHGPLFQRIVAIEGIDGRGARALLRPSTPGEAIAGAAEGTAWALDPILLDAALQVQVLWARLRWDVTLLPAEIGSHLRTGVPVPPGELVRLELRIRPESKAPLCHADHWFYGPDDRLLATLGDVVGVGTQALNRLAGARS
jgi:hypothetical protein